MSAHEVNQPLTAIISNADACLSLLPSDTNELRNVRQALSDIVNGADRASAVLARIRRLVKRSRSAGIVEGDIEPTMGG